MSELVPLARFGDLREGLPLIVSSGRQELAVVLWRGEVFAVKNVCPHQTQSFAGGYVHGKVYCTGEIGVLAVRADEPVLECPVHTWTFRLSDGVCVPDPSLRVKTYETEVVDGTVFARMDET